MFYSIFSLRNYFQFEYINQYYHYNNYRGHYDLTKNGILKF